jgi:SAM-dependent methyltransferase
MTTYVLRGGTAGAERLRVLGRVLWPTTEALLRRVGVAAGMRCLDVGCGIGAVALELARLVGPAGQVLGIDLDGQALGLAAEQAERERLPVLFRAGSALDLTEELSCDLAYARFLLSHLAEPERAVLGLARAARPGGVVVVEDTDFAGHFCYPACPAFDRYVALYREAVRRKGGDACLGPRLAELLENAGLGGVEVQVVSPAFRTGEGKRLAALTLEHIRETLRAEGLASSEEVDVTVAELGRFASDPRTIVSLPRLFQVWGRKQAACGQAGSRPRLAASGGKTSG